MNASKRFFVLSTLIFINIMQAGEQQRSKIVYPALARFHDTKPQASPRKKIVKILDSPKECLVKMRTIVYADGETKIRTETPWREGGGYQINYFHADPTKRKPVEFHHYPNQNNRWVEYFTDQGQWLYAARKIQSKNFNGFEIKE